MPPTEQDLPQPSIEAGPKTASDTLPRFGRPTNAPTKAPGEVSGDAPGEAEFVGTADPDAPVSFVPHTASGALPGRPRRFTTGRLSGMEEHELVRLLDSVQDERARSRFRESIYISFFVWIAIAWMIFYGPRYLWHAPKLVLPSDVLRQRELTRLEAPALSGAPAPRAAHPAARPTPHVDTKTLEHLRETAPKVPRPAAAPQPPVAVLPTRPKPNLPIPSTPQPESRPAPPVVADAPRPQPATRPNFNTGGSAGESIQNALEGAARSRGGSGGGGDVGGRSGGSALGTGVDILSDTQGVNFDPYIRRILREIYNQWIPLIPEEARPPLSKSGVTMIRFVILPDGNLGDIKLDDSTHDEALNRAAWGSIVGVGQFPPLPPQFKGPKLELRIHYLVNKKNE